MIHQCHYYWWNLNPCSWRFDCVQWCHKMRSAVLSLPIKIWWKLTIYRTCMPFLVKWGYSAQKWTLDAECTNTVVLAPQHIHKCSVIIQNVVGAITYCNMLVVVHGASLVTLCGGCGGCAGWVSQLSRHDVVRHEQLCYPWFYPCTTIVRDKRIIIYHVWGTGCGKESARTLWHYELGTCKTAHLCLWGCGLLSACLIAESVHDLTIGCHGAIWVQVTLCTLGVSYTV